MSILKSEVEFKTPLFTGWRFVLVFMLGSVCCILSSCHFKDPAPPPPGLLDEAEMSELICDMTLSEAALTNEPLAAFNDTLKKVNILREHHVTSQQFLLSMKYYSENPDKLKEIYAQAQELLRQRMGIGVDTTQKK